jgi:hypothetical protein
LRNSSNPTPRFFKNSRTIPRAFHRETGALLVAHTFGKAFPKSAQIPLAESGWKIDEAWPEKQGLSATLKGKSLQLDLTSEFRACVVSLRRG